MVLLNTRAEPVPGGRLARRPRFRFVRTGALLTVIGVLRLARMARMRWRISLGLCGALLVVLGHSVFTGSAGGVAGLLGLAVVLVAALKSGSPADARRPVPSQVAWRWHG